MRLCSITPFVGVLELRLYEINHSAATLKPKIAGAAERFRSSSASVIVRKCSGGIDPRNFQLLMADSPAPTSSATAVVPPRASTMSSTDLSMTQDSSRLVNLSRLHVHGMDFITKPNRNKGMDTKEVVGERIGLWLDSLPMTGADLCRVIDCAEHEWSQFRTGKRMITIEIAGYLCDEFGLTLDWIYRGVAKAEISTEVRIKMKELRTRPADEVEGKRQSRDERTQGGKNEVPGDVAGRSRR